MQKKFIPDEELMELAKRAAGDYRAKYTLPFEEDYVASNIYFFCSKRANERGKTYQLNDELAEFIPRVSRWLTDPDDTVWMMFMGKYGNGKTALARGVFDGLNELQYLSMSGFGKKNCFRTAKGICESFLCDRAEFEMLKDSDFLVIDDLGEEPMEVMNYGMVHTPIVDLLSERYERRLLTLMTTNLSGTDMEARYGGRIADRMREMTSTLIFTQPSFRKSNTD